MIPGSKKHLKIYIFDKKLDTDVNLHIAYINSTPKIKTFPNKDRIKLLNESKSDL